MPLMDVLTAYSERQGAVILDVRERYEWDAGHIDASMHIPIGEIAGRLAEVPAGRRVIVVCQIGQRSGLVAGFLLQNGYDAHNLEGGLARWTEEGLPLTGEDPRLVDGWARDLTGRRLGSASQD